MLCGRTTLGTGDVPDLALHWAVVPPPQLHLGGRHPSTVGGGGGGADRGGNRLPLLRRSPSIGPVMAAARGKFTLPENSSSVLRPMRFALISSPHSPKGKRRIIFVEGREYGPTPTPPFSPPILSPPFHSLHSLFHYLSTAIACHLS